MHVDVTYMFTTYSDLYKYYYMAYAYTIKYTNDNHRTYTLPLVMYSREHLCLQGVRIMYTL